MVLRAECSHRCHDPLPAGRGSTTPALSHRRQTLSTRSSAARPEGRARLSPNGTATGRERIVPQQDSPRRREPRPAGSGSCPSKTAHAVGNRERQGADRAPARQPMPCRTASGRERIVPQRDSPCHAETRPATAKRWRARLQHWDSWRPSSGRSRLDRTHTDPA